MYISIDVTKQKGGAEKFLADLPGELKTASETWKVTSRGSLSATIASTATITAAKTPVVYVLKEEDAGSVSAEFQTKGCTEDEKAKASTYLVYLCAGPLKSRVKSIRIDV
jgi:hypothetical protein